MRFTGVTSFITSALLASTAAAAPADPVARNELQARADCGAALKARGLVGGLVRRGEVPVGMNGVGEAKKDDDLVSKDISVCIGAAAVGEADDDDKPNKFIVHLGAGFSGTAWGDFIGKIKAARDDDWECEKAAIAAIDIATTDKPDEFTGAPGWDQAKKDRTRATYDRLKSELADASGCDVEEMLHDVNGAVDLYVKGDDEIKTTVW
ncbi:hypothetical protein LIA77_08199 [Sarocladium implicatum]|nr:hypothetical protein LIA77_08199 [Sarocladium implicatum]